MAIRSVLYHSSTLTAENLVGLPVELASQIWQSLVSSQLDSVQTWKAFASTYALECEVSWKRRHQIIENPNMKLGHYVKHLASSSSDWITFLTLSHITCSRTDLVQISQLPNIGVLTMGPMVIAEGIGVDDSLIRNWARVAATSYAFGVLRVISCRSQEDITTRLFSYLNDFPALACFNVENCNLGPSYKRDALCNGWKYRSGKVLSDSLIRDNVIRHEWDDVIHASFQLGGTYSIEALTADGVEAVDKIPRLHLSLGGHPQAAALDVKGEGVLRSFYRIESTGIPANKPHSSSDKRPRSQIQDSSTGRALKIPTLRASKKQNMEDVLFGFGN